VHLWADDWTLIWRRWSSCADNDDIAAMQVLFERRLFDMPHELPRYVQALQEGLCYLCGRPGRRVP
jgi:hypothetical protein